MQAARDNWLVPVGICPANNHSIRWENRMRILLIATNRHNRYQSRLNAQPMPIGLAYIAGHLDHERHEVKVLDLMFSDDYLADVEAAV